MWLHFLRLLLYLVPLPPGMSYCLYYYNASNYCRGIFWPWLPLFTAPLALNLIDAAFGLVPAIGTVGEVSRNNKADIDEILANIK